MKTAQEILESNCPSMNPLFLDDSGKAFRSRVIQAMEKYAQDHRAMKTETELEIGNKVRNLEGDLRNSHEVIMTQAFTVANLEIELKQLQKNYSISQNRYLKALTRCNVIEEWVLEYRDQLKKENVFHKNQGIINAINELLYPNTTHTLNFKGKCAHVHTEIQEFVQKYRCLDCGIYI